MQVINLSGALKIWESGHNGIVHEMLKQPQLRLFMDFIGLRFVLQLYLKRSTEMGTDGLNKANFICTSKYWAYFTIFLRCGHIDVFLVQKMVLLDIKCPDEIYAYLLGFLYNFYFYILSIDFEDVFVVTHSGDYIGIIFFNSLPSMSYNLNIHYSSMKFLGLETILLQLLTPPKKNRKNKIITF